MKRNPEHPAIAAGEPAVIPRLPKGVEYTHIKAIFMNLPSSLTTLLWADESSGDALLTAFKDRTVRAADRALRRAEESASDRRQVALIRHELVQLCVGALHAIPPHDRAITVEQVFPQLFAAEHQPAISVPHVRITVSGIETGRRRPKQPRPSWKVLETRTIVSEPADWSPSIPWFDTERVDRAILELVRAHCPRLMSVRVGPRWRSNYPSEGWRLITQQAVPALYEYLRPFYRVRPHRRSGREDGPGHYPARLRRDITDVVRVELPHLASKLTVARVTAAIQRHIARQHPTGNRSRSKRPKQ
jgi:hypothetical protein